uniref:Uncharacterized protein n=1 Tax=Plectus sambesii TaxID=2011161 RepID=A0A914VUQ7_9BILA
MSAAGQTNRERWIWGGLHGTSDDRPSGGPNQFVRRPPRTGPRPHSGATPVKRSDAKRGGIEGGISPRADNDRNDRLIERPNCAESGEP